MEICNCTIPSPCLIVVMRSLFSRQAAPYYETLIALRDEFDRFNVPVWLITTDTEKELGKAARRDQTGFQYISDRDGILMRALGTLQTRNCFGEEKEVLRTCAFVFEDCEPTVKYWRLKPEQLIELACKAFDIRYAQYRNSVAQDVLYRLYRDSGESASADVSE